MAEYSAARLAAPLPALSGIEFAPERDAFCATHAPASSAGGPGGGALFMKGQPPRAVHGDLREELMRGIDQLIAERKGDR